MTLRCRKCAVGTCSGYPELGLQTSKGVIPLCIWALLGLAPSSVSGPSHGRECRSVGLYRSYELQPIGIQTHRDGVPRLLEGAENRIVRKSRHTFLVWIGDRRLAKFCQCLGSCRIEVSIRHRRIRFPFTPQESLYIPPVFLQQGSRPILGVALEMNERTLLFLFCKQINASFSRFRQNGISGRDQIALR